MWVPKSNLRHQNNFSKEPNLSRRTGRRPSKQKHSPSKQGQRAKRVQTQIVQRWTLKRLYQAQTWTTIHLGTKIDQLHQYVISEGSTLQSKEARTIQSIQKSCNKTTIKSTKMDTKAIANRASQLMENMGSKAIPNTTQVGLNQTSEPSNLHNK